MADTCTLHILHTNDVHSNFANMPQIASCLRQNRQGWEARGERVLTVDIGDHVDRMSLKTEATWGRANVGVMNRSGYQYVTIGNNEGITFPKEKLDALYEHADFTVVAGNLIEPASGRTPQWAVPYAVHQWPDLRVAILGVTIPFVPFYRMMGWDLREPLPLIREQVAMLRPQVDVIVLLSHLGYQADCRLAREVDGLDVILGGHTHHLLEHGERIGRTLIAQAGRYGEHVGHVRLTWDAAAKQVSGLCAELFRTKDYLPEPELDDFLRREKQAAETLLARPAVSLSADLDIGWTNETPFGSVLAASLRKWTGAEVGLANGGLLLAPLKRGTVSYKDLLTCVPHPINPCAVTLTGEQLLGVLKRAVQPEMVQRELRGYGFRGIQIGWMGIDGLRVWYRPGERPDIERVEVNGQPLDPGRTYRVGTVDMFMFSRLFPELADGGEIRFYLPELLREILAVTLGDDELVRAGFQPRWLPVSI